MIKVKEIHSKKELKAFVKFPFTLYKGSKYWVPPIINQELKTFNPKVNPVFKDANAQFFLAYKNDKIVGRIAAIINWLEVKGQDDKKMRFGWFDTIDDIEVTKALLEKVEEIGRINNLSYIEGPLGFSNLDKVGVVTDGFEHIGSMITWYNHPYYTSHFQKLGYEIGKEYSESKFLYKNIPHKSFTRIQDLIKKRYQLKPLSFNKSKEILPYADEMFDVFSKSHESLASFVEINQVQRDYFKKKFIPFLDPEYVKFITDKDNKLIAFAIVTPSYSEALQKIKGKLFPFGFRHLLNARKSNDKLTFYLIGILPEYQNKGVTAIIFDEFYKVFTKNKIKECIRGPELVENKAIQLLWKNFKPEVFRKRCTFKKNIS